MNIFQLATRKIRGLRRIYRLLKDDRKHRRFLRTDFDARVPLPESAPKLLTAESHKLGELRSRYQALVHPAVVHAQWSGRPIARIESNLRYFRGDSPYVWHYRSSEEITRLKYFIFLNYIKSIDHRNLLNTLEEDGSFGCWHFDYPGSPTVSRDLLDSIAELSFLDRELQIFDAQELNVLDIGAGYGRLAHRMLTALPSIKRYTCVDAIAESTFLCDYHLEYRGLTDRADVVPLDEWESYAHGKRYDLAINIHSFSECRLSAVEWWIAQVRNLAIPRLMIIPNEPEGFLTNEGGGERLDFLPVIEAAGYRMVRQEPVFRDPGTQGILGIFDQFYLFELQQPGTGAAQ